MPLKAHDSHQLLTYDDAKVIVARLQKIGVPVSNMKEVSAQFGEVSVDSDDYTPDGQPYQFVADIWGAQMELGIVRDQIGAGGFNKIFALAEGAFTSQNPQLTAAKAYGAIMSLNGVTEDVDKLLAC